MKYPGSVSAGVLLFKLRDNKEPFDLIHADQRTILSLKYVISGMHFYDML